MNLGSHAIVVAIGFSEDRQRAFEYGRVCASGLAPFFRGSVAERVVRSAPGPVFTARDIEAV